MLCCRPSRHYQRYLCWLPRLPWLLSAARRSLTLQWRWQVTCRIVSSAAPAHLPRSSCHQRHFFPLQRLLVCHTAAAISGIARRRRLPTHRTLWRHFRLLSVTFAIVAAVSPAERYTALSGIRPNDRRRLTCCAMRCVAVSGVHLSDGHCSTATQCAAISGLCLNGSGCSSATHCTAVSGASRCRSLLGCHTLRRDERPFRNGGGFAAGLPHVAPP